MNLAVSSMGWGGCGSGTGIDPGAKDDTSGAKALYCFGNSSVRAEALTYHSRPVACVSSFADGRVRTTETAPLRGGAAC